MRYYTKQKCHGSYFDPSNAICTSQNIDGFLVTVHVQNNLPTAMKNKFRERGTGENFSLADMLYIQDLMDSNRSAA